MAKKLYPESDIQAIANAIRSKNGSSATYTVGQMATAISNIPSGGGGGGPVEKKQVNFIDYDGTILHSYTAAEANALTSLPSNPSHTGLTSQGWNWTLAQIKAQLTAMPSGQIWVGQMYITTSGDTEIDVTFTDPVRLSPYFCCAVNGTITIDWGDGSTSTVTGTSLTSRKQTQHVYASTGAYTIKVRATSGSWGFYCGSSYTMLHNNATASSEPNVCYASCIQHIRIGANTNLGNYSFYRCCSLETVTIPNNVTSIGQNVFAQTDSLRSVTLPANVTNIPSYTFYYCYSLSTLSIPSGILSFATQSLYYCYSLQGITIPNGITSISSYFCAYCHAIKSLVIPSGITTIPNYFCYYCNSLTSVKLLGNITSIGNYYCSNCPSMSTDTIPSTVTSIGTYFHQKGYGMKEYHILPTTVPTLGTSAFTNIQDDCIIYVPSTKLADYQGATNWSAQASKMVGE